MIRNQANQAIGAQMVNATTGAAFAGSVTVYITIDAGTQAIGSVGGGACQAEGNGYYSYLPSQAETDGNLIAFTFIGTGAIPATIQIATITVVQSANLAGGAISGASSSGRKIVYDAFLTLGIFAPGETPPDPDASFALGRLIALQSLQKLQALTSPFNVREVFTLTANKGGPANPYTIGPGGDFNTSRPASVDEITGWSLLLAGTSPLIEIPRAMLTDDAFRGIQIKDLPNPLWTDAYYNATYASGLGSITLWPVPNTGDNSLVLYRDVPLVSVTNLDATYDLPEGYFRMLSDALAEDIAATYGRADLLGEDGESGILPRRAKRSMAVVKRANTRLTDLPTDPALTHNRRGGYNILTSGGG